MLGTRGLKLTAVLAVVLAGTALAEPTSADPTPVKIDSGTVRGVAAGDVISFKGIPYAAPPVGNLFLALASGATGGLGLKAPVGARPVAPKVSASDSNSDVHHDRSDIWGSRSRLRLERRPGAIFIW